MLSVSHCAMRACRKEPESYMYVCGSVFGPDRGAFVEHRTEGPFYKCTFTVLNVSPSGK